MPEEGESPSPEGREKRWFTLDEARRALPFDNARQLLGAPNIDGALVGGACLKAEDFLAIIEAAN